MVILTKGFILNSHHQDEVKKAVEVLLSLKSQYKDLTGEDLSGGGRKDKKEKKKDKKVTEKKEEVKVQEDSKDHKKITRWADQRTLLLLMLCVGIYSK